MSTKQEKNEKPEGVVEQATSGEPDRAAWGNHCEYFLSSLGLAVGLGNIWRFPYVCYQNGGGTFIFPYLLMLLLVGLPTLFLEMVIGQYAGISSTKIFSRLSPGLRGMGYGMVVIPTLINFYYTVVMAYALYFLCMGFTSDLPWGLCTHDYNTPNCFSLVQNAACSNTTTFYNQTCTDIEEFCIEFNHDYYNTSFCQDDNGTLIPIKDVTFRVSASEEFWYRDVLDMNVNFTADGTIINTGIHSLEGEDIGGTSWSNWGAVNWKIAGCLLACWTLVCLSLIKGVQSYGKVVYFTTLFPYVVLTTLLIYVSTLDGFQKGIEFYIIPDWNELGNLEVWKQAATQIFYSLGVAVGSQLLLSSYNPFTTNCHRDALIIGLCNSLTSVYAGFVVFGVVGFMAHQKGVDVADVVDAGPALAFIVYPEAVTAMNPGPLFSFMFFFMLNLLAISSICGSWEAFIAAFLDEFPVLRTKRILVMVASCFMAFLFGFPMCFQSGFLLFQQMDSRTANAIALMAFFELTIVAWFYGIDALLGHVEEMGMKIFPFMKVFWRICWQVITPFIIAFVTINAWLDHKDDRYLNYVYPPGAQAIGWTIELLPIAIVVGFSLFTIIKKLINGQDIRYLTPGPMMTPKASWGPRADSGLGKPNQGLENPTYESP